MRARSSGSDVTTQMFTVEEKPLHHIDESLLGLVSTLEFGVSLVLRVPARLGLRPHPRLQLCRAVSGEFEMLVTPIPAYERLVPRASARRQRSFVRIPKTRTRMGSFWMRLPRMWVRTTDLHRMRCARSCLRSEYLPKSTRRLRSWRDHRVVWSQHSTSLLLSDWANHKPQAPHRALQARRGKAQTVGVVADDVSQAPPTLHIQRRL